MSNSNEQAALPQTEATSHSQSTMPHTESYYSPSIMKQTEVDSAFKVINGTYHRMDITKLQYVDQVKAGILTYEEAIMKEPDEHFTQDTGIKYQCNLMRKEDEDEHKDKHKEGSA